MIRAHARPSFPYVLPRQSCAGADTSQRFSRAASRAPNAATPGRWRPSCTFHARVFQVPYATRAGAGADPANLFQLRVALLQSAGAPIAIYTEPPIEDSPMRLLTLAALLSSLALGACDRGDTSGDKAGSAPRSAGVITGQLKLRDAAPVELPPEAIVTVRLLDGTRSDAPPSEVLSQQVATGGTLPLDYSLKFDPKSIEKMATYLVDANITANGQLIYLTQESLPVLTQGAGTTANIALIQGLAMTAPITEADDAKRLYAELETQLGAMKRVVGSRIEGDITVGWDGFTDERGVRMVRENVDYGDEGGGKATFQYAYRDAKPWVAVKDQGGARTMIAWDRFGNLVMRETTRKGAVSEASEELAAELKRSAEQIHETVLAKSKSKS